MRAIVAVCASILTFATAGPTHAGRQSVLEGPRRLRGLSFESVEFTVPGDWMRDPRLQGRIYSGSLPGLAAEIGRKFDGILCSAVFQHIPREQQSDAAVDIRNLLKPGGRLLLFFPKDRPGINEFCRDENGRLYIALISEAIQSLFESLGFRCLGQWDNADSLSRPGFTWSTLLLRLNS